MKVVSYEMGRILVLFPTEELRPRAGLYIPHLVDAVRKKYNFLRFPDLAVPLEEFYKNGYIFNHGSANINEQPIVIEEIGIFNDGITVTCRNTDDAGYVWADVMNWAASEFQLKDIISAPVHLYRSQIVVQFDSRLSDIFKEFSKLSSAIGDSIRTVFNNANDVDVYSLSFGYDRQAVPGLAIANFVIERRAGSPFSSNRFFCEAPLPTREHINILEQIETNFMIS